MFKLSNLLILNICIFILFLVQIITGGWIWYDFTMKMRPSTELIGFHPINGVILTIFIALHVYMNRRWIKTQLMPK